MILKIFLTLCLFSLFFFISLKLFRKLFYSVHFSSTQTFIEGLFGPSMASRLVVLSRGGQLILSPWDIWHYKELYFTVTNKVVCVRSPYNHLRFARKDSQGLAYRCTHAMIYYSKRVQSVVSKGKRCMG